MLWQELYITRLPLDTYTHYSRNGINRQKQEIIDYGIFLIWSKQNLADMALTFRLSSLTRLGVSKALREPTPYRSKTCKRQHIFMLVAKYLLYLTTLQAPSRFWHASNFRVQSKKKKVFVTE